MAISGPRPLRQPRAAATPARHLGQPAGPRPGPNPLPRRHVGPCRGRAL